MAHVFKLSAGARIFVVIAVVFSLSAVGYAALVKFAEANVSPVPIPTPVIDPFIVHTDYLKSQQDNLKNIRRELSDVKRVAKNIDTTTLDVLLNQWEACIQARQADVGKDIFNIEECVLLNVSVKDEFYKNIFPQKNCAEMKIKINEYKKEKKNIERQIKDLLRTDKNVDVSALRGIISQMDESLVKADPLNCNGDEKDSLEQIHKELGALSSDFYNTISDLQNKAGRKSNFESMVKRPCADSPAFLNKLERQMKAKAKKYPEIYGDVTSKINNMREISNQRCGDLLNQMKAALQNNDTDAYNDAYSVFNDLGTELGDIQTSFYEADQQAGDIENVKNIGKELKKQISELKARKKGQLLKYKKAYARASKKVISSEDQKKNLDAFDEYTRQADELLAKMTDELNKTKQAQNNPDPALVEEIREIQNEFSEIQQEWLKLTNIMTRLVPGIEGMIIGEPFGNLESIRRATNNDPQLMNVLDEIASQANDLLNQAWKIAITSPDEALEILMSRQDLHYDWTDAADAWKENHGIEEFDYSGGPQRVEPEQVLNETADWKTYTNTKHGYQFKVPNDFYNRAKPSSWIGESDDNSLSFVRGDLWYIEITYIPDASFYNPPPNTNLVSWLKKWNMLRAEYQTLEAPNFEINSTPAVKFYSPGMPQSYDVDEIYFIKKNKLFEIQLVIVDEATKKLSYQILSTFKFTK